MTPTRHSPAIVWAVFLGANTPCRLAREWGISKAIAATRMCSARSVGYLSRFGRGGYAVADRFAIPGERSRAAERFTIRQRARRLERRVAAAQRARITPTPKATP